jgi:hypothetical protein
MLLDTNSQLLLHRSFWTSEGHVTARAMSTSRMYLNYMLQCSSTLLFPRGVHDGGDMLTLAQQGAKPGDESVKYITRSACHRDAHSCCLVCDVDLVLSGRLPARRRTHSNKEREDEKGKGCPKVCGGGWCQKKKVP